MVGLRSPCRRPRRGARRTACGLGRRRGVRSVVSGSFLKAGKRARRLPVTRDLHEAESHVRVPAKIAIDFSKMSRSMRSRSFSRCKRAISAAWSADGSVALRCGAPRRRRRLQPGPALLHPPPQHGIAQAKLLGNRSDRAPARRYKINRLPLVVVRKRPTLTSFHPTPPGSSSLLRVSINSEEVHFGISSLTRLTRFGRDGGATA
ncbi:hypothetical protein SAMN05216337_107818 [Bradyrhizobium brasilense]|uniref:Uncharacterized protein n=1 Tax=Bradyrhizobium brasilense TaxID=1419277 RepID=A0A1G7PEB4_9BRAD|nr:hypothetical protein SAMN05216337_107818 [Bradyrhizobium brasilense]